MKKLLYPCTLILALSLIVSCKTTDGIVTKPTDESREKPKNSYTKIDEDSILAITNQEPDGEVYTLESFEDGNFWYAQGEENPLSYSSTSAAVTEQWYSSGSYAGEWSFKSSSSKKPASFVTDAPLITLWSDYRYLVLDVNNTSSSPLVLKVTLQSGDGKYTDSYELHNVTIGKGINTNVIFDLVNGVILNGNPVHGIGEEDLSKVIFEVINDTKGGTIYIDSIRLIK